MKFVRIFDPKTNLNFVRYFKLSWILTGALIVAVVVGLLTLGMPWSIDFLGGTEMQVKFQKTVSAAEVRKILTDLGFEKNQVQQLGSASSNEILIRIESMTALNDRDLDRVKGLVNEHFPKAGDAKDRERILFDKRFGSQLTIWLDEPYDQAITDPFQRKTLIDDQRNKLLMLFVEKGGVELRKTLAEAGKKADTSAAVTADEPQGGRIRYTVHFAGATEKIQKELQKHFGEVEIRKVDFVDSQVSRQLRTDGLLAVIYAIIAIVVYIALRFDVYFSPGAVFSLINDTLGALLIFIYFRVEFDVPSIAALLTIIGYSVNNTVVIYDRIREIMPNNPKKPLPYEEIKLYVNRAINETLSRTINSTFTTLLASIPIWIFATGSIQSFAIVLSVGIVIGAFSSAFVAPAAFLLAKKYIHPSSRSDSEIESSGGHTREDKAKGVV